jgi:DNA-binding response OmpR family regulator
MVGASSEPITGSLLLVEDDHKLGTLVSRFLQEQGYQVQWASDAAAALRHCRNQVFDLVICDLMLPDEHGFTLFDRINRDSAMPFIFLTALGDDDSHIEGLDRGAVDYLIKPVEPQVLLARVRAQLRRKKAGQPSSRQIQLERFVIDASTRVAHSNEQALDLTRQEFELLWLLAQYPNTILGRELLFDAVTERDYDGKDRIVDGRVSRLRRKLEAAPGNLWTIRTVWGRGYMFCQLES